VGLIDWEGGWWGLVLESRGTKVAIIAQRWAARERSQPLKLLLVFRPRAKGPEDVDKESEARSDSLAVLQATAVLSQVRSVEFREVARSSVDNFILPRRLEAEVPRPSEARPNARREVGIEPLGGYPPRTPRFSDKPRKPRGEVPQ
jgi:hypothetical protein